MTTFDVETKAALRTAARNFFQRVFARVDALTNAVPDANERANVACKSLSLFAFERGVDDGVSDAETDSRRADRRARIAAQVERVRAFIAEVDDGAERAYLRRLLTEAILNADDADFFRSTLDALVAEIDDADERQNAVFALALAVLPRPNAVPCAGASDADVETDLAKRRDDALALADELDDLGRFETVVAKAANAFAFGAPSFARLANADDETICDVVRRESEALESPDGFLKLFDAEAAPFDAARRPAAPAIRRAFWNALKPRLAAVRTALETGVDESGAELGADERAALETFAANVKFFSPNALADGEFVRDLVERFDAFGAFEPIFRTLGEDVARLDDESERTRYLESARRLAERSTDVETKTARLVELASFEFRFGDGERAKNDVRAALALLPKNESRSARVAALASLVKTHLDAKMPKTARKLAAALEKELNAFDAGVSRDFALSSRLPLLAKACDRADVDRLVDSLDSPVERFRRRAEIDLAEVIATDDVSTLCDRLTRFLDETSADAERLYDEPDEAALEPIRFAQTVYSQLLSTF